MKLYCISDEYIDFVRKKYERVFSNKEGQRTHLRKYLGVVLNVKNYKYYIPLSSPKDHDYIIEESKKKIRKDSLIVLRMKHKRDGQEILLGTIQIGTMIPVPDSEIWLYDLNSEKDEKYKDLVKNELSYIKKNEDKIIKNAKTLYAKKEAGNEEKLISNCFDFIGAQELCDEWNEKIKKDSK